MAKRRVNMSLGVVFRAPPSCFTTDKGREFFRDVVPGFQDPPRPRELALAGLEKRARVWVEGHFTAVNYMSGPPTYGSSLWVQVSWHHLLEAKEMVLQVPLTTGERLSGIAVQDEDIGPHSDPRLVDFFLDRAIAMFDFLQAPWGIADHYNRIPYGTKRDPRPDPHWVTFLGPGHDALVRSLEEAGVKATRRPWGGTVLRAWDSPFQPPDKKRLDELAVAMRRGAPWQAAAPDAAPSIAQGRTHAQPTGDRSGLAAGVLVAGVDADAPFDAKGRSLMEMLRAGELGRGKPGAGAAYAALEAALGGGELRAFVAEDMTGAVVGVEVERLGTKQAPYLAHVDVGAVEAALGTARKALARLGLAGEPGLHLVWVGEEGS